jgi:hypothetical protein
MACREPTPATRRIMYAVIEYSDDSMWGDNEEEQDVGESYKKFEVQVLARLKEIWPEIEVEFRNDINNTIRTDDTYDQEIIENVVHDVWEAWDWIVDK